MSIGLFTLIAEVLRRKKKRKKPKKKKDAISKSSSSTTLYLSHTASSTPLWEVDKSGFLPSRPPREAPSDDRFCVLSEIVEMVPTLAMMDDSSSFLDLIRRRESAFKAAVVALIEIREEDELECVHGLYSYLVCGLIKCGVSTIPEYVARGFKMCADRLNRRPMLDYAGCVLYNWALVDPQGPVSVENVRMLRRFTGLIDEEWFFKTHLVLEAAAGDAVMAMKEGLLQLESKNNYVFMIEVLRRIETSIGVVVRDCLPLMFERRGEHGALCDYYFFFHRLRPFMSGCKNVIFCGIDHDTPLTLPGPSGAMSTLLPCLDAFLGVKNSSSKLSKLLADFSKSMPISHRGFLRKISEQSLSIRTLIIQARKYRKSQDTDIVEALATQFERCIDLLLDFRWRHLQMVRKYIVEPSGGDASSVAGTGGTAALEYLHEHIADTEAAKLPSTGESWFLGGGVRRVNTVLISPKPKFTEPETTGEESDELWHVNAENGLLPRRQPVLPSHGFDHLESVVLRLPYLCVGRRLHAVVQSLQFSLEKIKQLNIDELEGLRVRLAFMAAAYQRCDSVACVNPDIPPGDTPLPLHFKEVYDFVADLLDRPKRLCFTDLVICNLRMSPSIYPAEKIQQNKKKANVDSLCPYASMNQDDDYAKEERCAVIPACSFLAVPEEVSLFSILFQTERSSPAIVAAILSSMNNPRKLTESLQSLRMTLRDAALRHDTETTHVARADKSTMRRLRHFLLPAGASDLELASMLYSGDSVLLPIVWRFLGIPKSKAATAELQRVRDALLHNRAVPTAHRNFLRRVSSIRDNVLRICTSTEPLHHLARLEAAYNGCVDELLRLCSRRSQLVCRYLPHFASEFRDIYFEHDRRALLSARLSLLLDRRLNQRRPSNEVRLSFSE